MTGPAVPSIVLLVMLLCACSSTSGALPETAPRGAAVSRQAFPPAASDTERGSQFGSSRTYRASVRQIGPEVRARMRFSHRRGCPMPVRSLRYLRLSYIGFDGESHTGELVVHKDYAQPVTRVFEQLYEATWPIQRMQLVDAYRGNDDRSMAANNTSGYNCRHVAGTETWSAHAYGAALDINPVQNPEVTGSSVRPPSGRRFAAIDRSARATVPSGTVRAGDVVVRSFARIGWEWGGDWSSPKDYQHFSAGG